jgi:hypothetical protein
LRVKSNQILTLCIGRAHDGLDRRTHEGLDGRTHEGLSRFCIGLAGKNKEKKREHPDLVREARVVALQAIHLKKKEFHRIYHQARRSFLRAQPHSVMNQQNRIDAQNTNKDCAKAHNVLVDPDVKAKAHNDINNPKNNPKNNAKYNPKKNRQRQLESRTAAAES